VLGLKVGPVKEVKLLDAGGDVSMKGTKRQERFKKSTGFIQKNHPFPVTSCGRRRPLNQKLKYNKGK
jgi:hypothetical protein